MYGIGRASPLARSHPHGPGGPMSQVFAVFQYGWRDVDCRSVALGDGVCVPPKALIGLCRDRARAARAARRIRRATRAAIAHGLRSREALVGVCVYDPREFLLQHDRRVVTRREAHTLATTGMMARREQLGVR
jgi:hypothetical protein